MPATTPPPVAHAALLAALADDGAKADRIRARAAQAALIEPAGAGAWRLTTHGAERSRAVDRAWRLWQFLLREQPESAALFSDLDVESIDRLLPSDAVLELEEKLRTAADPTKDRLATHGAPS